jgi:hypothetical protein
MSITTVNFQPKVWSSGYNPIMWSVTSNQNTQVDMKYVFDIFMNSAPTYTYRIKQRPNPAGAGMIDVSTLTQAYLDMGLYNPELATTPYISYTEFPAFVSVRVGEEYLINGSLNIFNGSGATGSPAYQLLPYGVTGSIVRVLPSALDFNQQMGIMTATATTYPFWDTYFMDGNGKFLSLEPGERSVRLTDRHTLAFLNRWDTAPGSYAASVQAIRVIRYNAAGSTIGTDDFYNNTGQGGGPQTNNTYLSTTETRSTDILHFRCGPWDLGPISFANTAYYTVTAYYKASATSDPTLTTVASETIRFNIDRECEDLYQNVRISWLNSLGGRDYYNFKMFYEKTTNSKQETYNQNELNYSALSPVTVAAGSSVYNRGGDKVFNKVVETTFEIQTDYLPQSYVDYLAGIPESPSTWAYIGDANNTPYTIVIENVEYTYKNVKQTKLVQATFTCKYTKTQIKQNM